MIPQASSPRWATWWARNWRWFLPSLGCLFPLLVGMLCVALLLNGLTTALRRAPLYQDALRRAQNNPEVVRVLGRPITARGRLRGSMTQRQNGVEAAEMTVPIAGPRGRATLRLAGNQTGERVSYAVLTVTPENDNGPGARIDLLQNETSPGAGL